MVPPRQAIRRSEIKHKGSLKPAQRRPNNATHEEYNDYAFAALLSDDDDKMHAALDSLLTSDIGRSTQQEAAALYERQEREEIARLEQMQHDAPVMRMTRS